MINLSFGFGGVYLGIFIHLFLVSVAVWIVLPEKENPYADGFWKTIGKCAILTFGMMVALLVAGMVGKASGILAIVTVIPVFFIVWHLFMWFLFKTSFSQSAVCFLSWFFLSLGLGKLL